MTTATRHPALNLAPLDVDLHDRWVLASQIAHRLAPAAWAGGAFATAAVRVAVPGHAPRRPAVAVVLGEPPRDPVVSSVPVLVVELAPACEPAAWLARGVQHVWSVGADGAWCSAADAEPRFVAAPGVLRLQTGARPDPLAALTLTLPVLPGRS